MKNKKDNISIRKIVVIILVLVITLVLFWFILSKENVNNFDYIPIIITFIFIAAIIILFSLIPDSIFFNKQHTYVQEKNDVIKEAKIKRDIWQRSAMIWQFAHYFFQALSAIFLAIIIYISVNEDFSNSILLYSILSFGVMFANFILNPNKISLAYSQSYVDIYSALMEYDAGIIDKKDIAVALSKCEQRISDNTH